MVATPLSSFVHWLQFQSWLRRPSHDKPSLCQQHSKASFFMSNTFSSEALFFTIMPSYHNSLIKKMPIKIILCLSWKLATLIFRLQLKNPHLKVQLLHILCFEFKWQVSSYRLTASMASEHLLLWFLRKHLRVFAAFWYFFANVQVYRWD